MTIFHPHTKSTDGFTLVELIITVAVLSILMAIASASYDTLQARARCSQAKSDMDAIAQAGYTEFSNKGSWTDTPADISAEPQDFINDGLLSLWPVAPCPGMFFAWENWANFDINAVRVTLYRPDATALWSYCVNVYGGGSCDMTGAADAGLGPPIEISTATVTYLYCND